MDREILSQSTREVVSKRNTEGEKEKAEGGRPKPGGGTEH